MALVTSSPGTVMTSPTERAERPITTDGSRFSAPERLIPPIVYLCGEPVYSIVGFTMTSCADNADERNASNTRRVILVNGTNLISLSFIIICHLFASQSVTTLTALIFINCLAEFLFVEIGPQHLGKVEFRIGQLPQQEVAQTLFLTGADKQVGVGHE